MKKNLLAIFLLLCVSVTASGEELFSYVPGNPVILAYANIENLGNGTLKSRIVKLNKDISKRAGGQYDFSDMVDSFAAGVFNFDGDFASENQLILLRGKIVPESFFGVIERSLGQPLARTTINSRPAVIFPKRALNRNLRERMELCAVSVADNLMFIGSRAKAATLKPIRPDIPGELKAMPEMAFLGVYFRPDPALPYSFLFAGVKEAFISAEPYGAGGIKFVGKVPCASNDVAVKLAANLKQLLSQFIIIALHKDIPLAMESVSKFTTFAEDGEVTMELVLDDGVAKRVFDYAAANVPVK